MPPPIPSPGEGQYLAFWVATRGSEVVGSLGVYPLIKDEMPPGVPTAEDWRMREDLVELNWLLVSQGYRRRGVATTLCQTAIQWCREASYRTLVLNTTAPQIPAMNLYKKLGFRPSDLLLDCMN